MTEWDDVELVEFCQVRHQNVLPGCERSLAECVSGLVVADLSGYTKEDFRDQIASDGGPSKQVYGWLAAKRAILDDNPLEAFLRPSAASETRYENESLIEDSGSVIESTSPPPPSRPGWTSPKQRAPTKEAPMPPDRTAADRMTANTGSAVPLPSKLVKLTGRAAVPASEMLSRSEEANDTAIFRAEAARCDVKEPVSPPSVKAPSPPSIRGPSKAPSRQALGGAKADPPPADVDGASLLKVAVLGGGAVGKSALTIMYMQQMFVTEYDPTIEDTYRKNSVIDGRSVMIDILDTAGQEEYSAMRESYMREGEGFLLVYSITSRDSFDEAIDMHECPKTILKVKDVASGVPLLLVGNKADLEDQREVPYSEAQELANLWNVPLLETSALSGENVTEAFSQIVREIWKSRVIVRAQGGSSAKPRAGCQLL